MESIAQVGGSPGTIVVNGVTYEVCPLTIRDLGEFESFLREDQQRQYVDFHTKFQRAGKPVGFEERARAMAKIVTTPFTFHDLIASLDTMTGARWMMQRALRLKGETMPKEQVDELPGGAVLGAITAVAMKAGIIDASDVQETPVENPTSPPPEP